MSDSTPITRLNAALEGRYRIERELGEGGMATVYLADDLKHGRKVALKVLKPELAAVVGAERFLAEIKTTANLQHPHILPLFDSGEAEAFLFYVMPYVEGESLRDRLDRDKQLPVDEAVRLATDVAEALHAAHQQGVIHRDIKPANILMSQGRPLIADFGIALAVSAAGGGRLTETGLSMGTPYYMSPEQASADREPSASSDVYSLGCVLYEMLVGEPPYVGGSAQAVLAKILTEDARSATKARPSIPENVDATLRKSLEKLPADRFASADAFAKALADPLFRHGSATAAPTPPASASPWNRLSLAMTGVAAVALVVAAWAFRPAPSTPAVTTRAVVDGVNRGVRGGWRLAISPDGRWIVSEQETEPGARELAVRSADDPTWRTLPDTRDASFPAFSPDGEWVVFTSREGGLTKVPVTGGPALPVTSRDGDRHRHAHWGVPETIVFSAGQRLLSVDATGGAPTLLLESDSAFLLFPHLLPSGDALLYNTAAQDFDVETMQTMVLDIATGATRRLFGGGSRPAYAPTGHLLYAHKDGALMGVGFDPESLELTGSPATIVTGVTVNRITGTARYSVSGTGTLIYDSRVIGTTGGERRLVEVDLAGEETPLAVVGTSLHEPRYAPDGRNIVYADGLEIRVFDILSGANPDFARGFEPKWSRDGAWVYLSLGNSGVMRRRADRSQEPEIVTEPGITRYVTSMAPGDSMAVVRERSEERGWDLRIMRLGADGVELEDLLVADWNEVNADVSPDGRWVAYEADEEGVPKIYVRSFPVIGEKHTLSPSGGRQPLWSPDGRAVYYIDGGRFMAVDVTTEPTFSASEPRLLFESAEYLYLDPGTDHNWGIHPDGSRFILVKDEGAVETDDDVEQSAPIYIVTNWFEELCARVGGC